MRNPKKTATGWLPWTDAGVRLMGGGGLTFLLRDDFTTAEAAPLASPRTAEPGPGTWSIRSAGTATSEPSPARW